MQLSRKKILLFFVLILAIISVFLMKKVQTNASDEESPEIRRFGTVKRYPEIDNPKYNVEREIFTSGGGGSAPTQNWTWNDVLSLEPLLCNERNAPIPGRTLASGISADFMLHPLSGSGVDIDYRHSDQYVECVQDFDSVMPSLPLVYINQKELWKQVYGMDGDCQGAVAEVEYTLNTYAKYEQTGTVGDNLRFAYVLSELLAGGPEMELVTVQIIEDENGNAVEHTGGDCGHTETGYLQYEYKITKDSYTIHYGKMNTITLTDEELDGRGKAGSLIIVGEGGTYTVTTYSEAFIITTGKEKIGTGTGRRTLPPGLKIRVEVKRRGQSIQGAWWGLLGYGGNALSVEAELFASYRSRLKGDYTPQWIGERHYNYKGEEYNLEEMVTLRDQTNNETKIGPLAIEYLEASANVHGRPYIQFAGIVDFEVYTNTSETPLKLEEDFEFEYVDENRTDTDFPHDGEVFFIVLKKDIEDAKAIDKIRVYFRYMEASGSYANYEGKFKLYLFRTNDISLKFRHVIDSFEAYNDKIWSSNNYHGNIYVANSSQNVYAWMRNNEPYKSKGQSFADSASEFGVNYWSSLLTKTRVIGYECVDSTGKVLETFTSWSSANNYKKEHSEVKEIIEIKETDYGYTLEGDRDKRIQLRFEVKNQGLYSIEDSQKLSWGIHGEKIYKYCELEREVTYKTAKIFIHKDLVDDDGKIINDSDPNRVFNFRVTVTGAENSYSEVISVRPGQTIQATDIYWKSGNPSYTVTEELDDKYELVSLENSSGSLKAYDEVVVTAKNKYKESEKNRGWLSIDKDITSNNLLNMIKEADREKVKLEGKNFIFKVKVTGNFEYNNTKYDNDHPLEFEQAVVGNGEIWKSEEFKWIGNKAPIYEITELRVEGLKVKDNNGNWIDCPNPVSGVAFELDSSINSQGELINTQTIIAHFQNKYKEEYASLGIIKTLEIPGETDELRKYYDEQKIENTKFYFDIKIDVENDSLKENRVTLSPKRVDNDPNSQKNEWVWEYNTEDIYWVYGANPEYEITEVEELNPDYMSFDSTETENRNNEEGNSDLFGISIDGKTLKGQMRAEESKKHVVVNDIINKIDTEIKEPEKGKVSVKKIVDDSKAKAEKDPETGEDVGFLHNEKYRAIVVIEGTFTYIDELGNEYICNNEKLQLTKRFKDTDDKEYEAVKIIGDNYNNNYIELEIEKAGPSVSASREWISKDIIWQKGGTPPKFYVEEKAEGLDCITTITPNEKIELESGETKRVTICNTKTDSGPNSEEYEIKKGYLNICKELEGIELCSQDYINSLSFKFQVDIEYKHLLEDAPADAKEAHFEVILDLNNYNLETKKWELKGVDSTGLLELMWYGDNAPEYTIKEVEIQQDRSKIPASLKEIELKEYRDEDGRTETGEEIKGKIKESIIYKYEKNDGKIKTKVFDKNVVNIITAVNKFISDSDPSHKGKLKIIKEVTNKVIENKEYKFKVIIKGKFKYDGGEPIENYELDYEEVIINPSVQNYWESKEIEWNGNDEPQYFIEEKETHEGDEDYTNSKEKTSYHASGTIKDTSIFEETIATFINEPEYENDPSGNLSINLISVGKKFDNDNAIGADKMYKFRVSITYYDVLNEETGNIEDITKVEYHTVKANKKFVLGPYKWVKGTKAPTYVIEEIDESGNIKYRSDGNNSNEGQLISGQTVEYNSIDRETNNFSIINDSNNIEKHSRAIIKKVVIGNKYAQVPDKSFKILVTISGNFKVGGPNEAPISGSKTYEVWLKNGETYETDEIYWEGNKAPTVSVKEDTASSFGDDLRWRCVGISHNNVSLVDEQTNPEPIVVTNQWDIELPFELTIDLAGQVWEDEDQDPYSKASDNTGIGIMNSTERGIGGVEVYIYKNGELATIPNQSQPLITDDGGFWEASNIKMESGSKFSVKYIYDGQTYEATTPLVNGPLESYVNSSDKSGWFDNSVCSETNREEVDNRIQVIYGGSPINGNGYTEGKANGETGEVTLRYEARITDVLSGENMISSELQTLQQNGITYDVFKTEADTLALYPFDDYIVLTDVSRDMYGYSATQPYCKHINLGLKKRPESDLGAIKNLESAKVTVQGKEYKYTFNKLEDYGASYLQRRLEKDSSTEKYELGLYSTGYYYRAEIYQTESRIYDAIVNKELEDAPFKSLEDLEKTEMEIELTYKIVVYNESQTYNMEIYSINDYVDKDLGQPIKTEFTNCSGEWVEQGTLIGSDSITYRKMSMDLASLNGGEGVVLGSGDNLQIDTTYKVQKKGINALRNTILTGRRSNVVEVSKYQSLYLDYRNAGKIDRDSAPDNVNIRSYNIKGMYEDDTNCGQILKLDLIKDKKDVIGTVWEDSKKENESIGDGLMDTTNEARIAGLTIQMVEIVEGIDKEGNKREYEFVWPTNKKLGVYGGKTIEQVMGFDSTIESATKEAIEKYKPTGADDPGIEAGDYKFSGIPNGKFVIKYLYGNNKINLEDNFGITGPAYAAKSDGSYYNDKVKIKNSAGEEEEHQIYVANYDKEKYGSTPAVYNGQDFKGTIYRGGMSAGELLTDKELNLNDISENPKYSYGRDNEVRRLEVIQKSETIKNNNGELLNTANRDNDNHTKLYDEYYMYANTPLIDMTSENPVFDLPKDESNNDTYGIAILKDRNSLGKDDSGAAVELEGIIYTAKNLDFGLIERPENAIVLDKQINEIKITTNDSKVIFNAKYNISYEEFKANSAEEIKELKKKTIIAYLGDNNYLVVKISLDKESIGTEVLQALNKFESKLTKDTDAINSTFKNSQNFRFVQMDNSILQGATVTIKYQFTALNIGEKDFANAVLTDLQESVIEKNKEVAKQIKNTTSLDEIEKLKLNYTTVKTELDKIIEEKRKKDYSPDEDLEIGKVLGSFYYTGTESAEDKLVRTRIRQVVDYIDNDAVFIQEKNKLPNASWRNSTIRELSGGGTLENVLISKKVLPSSSIKDKDQVAYIDDSHNNIALSIDDTFDIPNVDEDTEETRSDFSNSDFTRELQPYITLDNGEKDKSHEEENSKYHSTLRITSSRVVASEKSADDMMFDNIGEIVVIENNVGRRDMTAVPGNANPMKGEFKAALEERDAGATEIITFTPPTGVYDEEEIIRKQSYIAILAALLIATVGIVVIQKKVLPNNKENTKKKTK